MSGKEVQADAQAARLLRLESYRREYRAEVIPPGYSARANVIANVSVCMALGLGAAVLAGRWSGPVLVSFALGLVLFNFFEYAFHRWVSHRKWRVLGASYRRHSGEHHGFFERRAMSSDQTCDFHVTIMPTVTIIVYFAAFSGLLGIPLGLVLGRAAGYAFGAAIAFSLLQLDLLHCYYHLDEGRVLARIFDRLSYLRCLKRWHAWHHERELMSRSGFNITHPLFDWLLRTQYAAPCAARTTSAVTLQQFQGNNVFHDER